MTVRAKYEKRKSIYPAGVKPYLFSLFILREAQGFLATRNHNFIFKTDYLN